MRRKHTFSTPSGRDFKIFAQGTDFLSGVEYNYEEEFAVEEYPFGDAYGSFDVTCGACFFQDKLALFITSDDFVVPPKRREAFSKALLRVNANLEGGGTGFCTFSYRPENGLQASIAITYGEGKKSLEPIRKAFLSLWGAVLTHYRFLEAVALGRAFNRAKAAKNLFLAASYFGCLFNEIAKDDVRKYDRVMNLLEPLLKFVDLPDDDGDDDEMEEDPPFDEWDDDATWDDGSSWDDDLKLRYDKGMDAVLDFNARLMRAVMGTSFDSRSARRRRQDLTLLEQARADDQKNVKGNKSYNADNGSKKTGEDKNNKNPKEHKSKDDKEKENKESKEFKDDNNKWKKKNSED